MPPPLEQNALAEPEARTELQRRLQSAEEAGLVRRARQLKQEMQQREAVLTRALLDSRQKAAARDAALAERDVAVANLKAELAQIHASRLWRFTRFLRRAGHL